MNNNHVNSARQPDEGADYSVKSAQYLDKSRRLSVLPPNGWFFPATFFLSLYLLNTTERKRGKLFG